MKLDSLSMTGAMGTEITLRKTEVERVSVLRKLDGLYDEFSEMVFLFDISGSMTERVAKDKHGASFTDQYVWDAKTLADIRNKVTEAMAKYNQLASDPMAMLLGGRLTADEETLCHLHDDQPGPNGEMTFYPTDDEDLKSRIITHDLISLFGIPVDWTKHAKQPPTRLELVRKLAKSELEARFQKYPNSRVAVIPFATTPEVRFDDGTAAQLWSILEKLEQGLGSGTDILAAIRQAMEICRKNPSQVGVHHFILVSDGEDYVADSTIVSWVPTLKASGVVLDYIHIGDHAVNAGLKEACKQLGGDAVTVNDEKSFTARFVEATQRRMLPAPAAA